MTTFSPRENGCISQIFPSHGAFGYVFLRQFKGHKLPPPEFKAVGYVDACKSQTLHPTYPTGVMHIGFSWGESQVIT